jgi:hypothetical protein
LLYCTQERRVREEEAEAAARKAKINELMAAVAEKARAETE